MPYARVRLRPTTVSDPTMALHDDVVGAHLFFCWLQFLFIYNFKNFPFKWGGEEHEDGENYGTIEIGVLYIRVWIEFGSLVGFLRMYTAPIKIRKNLAWSLIS